MKELKKKLSIMYSAEDELKKREMKTITGQDGIPDPLIVGCGDSCGCLKEEMNNRLYVTRTSC